MNNVRHLPPLDAAQKVRRAMEESVARRPYQMDAALIAAVTPAGGQWECVADDIVRIILWKDRQVAWINPRNDFNDAEEGQVAMAFRSMPLLDIAMRAILVLAESPDNLSLIRRLAAAVIATVEIPAPEIEPAAEFRAPEIDDPA